MWQPLLGILVRVWQPCVMSPPYLQVLSSQLQILLTWVQISNMVLTMLILPIPWESAPCADGIFAAVLGNRISKTGDADGAVLYFLMLRIEWVSEAKESDAITNFRGNGHARPLRGNEGGSRIGFQP